MLDRGKVFALDGGSALVDIAGVGECRGCAACQMFAAGHKGVAAVNGVGAVIGDEVEVEIVPVTKMSAPALAFGLPFLCFLFGVIAGAIWSELFSFIGGAIGLAVGLISARWLDLYSFGRGTFRSRLVRKLT
ncbi:MAG: SoxR reducing system RseC family protein [Candidatus Margulisiibacteriota bacterium]